MMRFIAEMLFWIGRWEVVYSLALICHVCLIFKWRKNFFKASTALGWLLVFFIGSLLALISSFPFSLSRAANGTGYLYAHLYRGIWSDKAALVNMIQRWQYTWFPAYGQWLGLWMLGLLFASVSPRVYYHFFRGSSLKSNQ